MENLASSSRTHETSSRYNLSTASCTPKNFLEFFAHLVGPHSIQFNDLIRTHHPNISNEDEILQAARAYRDMLFGRLPSMTEAMCNGVSEFIAISNTKFFSAQRIPLRDLIKVYAQLTSGLDERGLRSVTGLMRWVNEKELTEIKSHAIPFSKLISYLDDNPAALSTDLVAPAVAYAYGLFDERNKNLPLTAANLRDRVDKRRYLPDDPLEGDDTFDKRSIHHIPNSKGRKFIELPLHDTQMEQLAASTRKVATPKTWTIERTVAAANRILDKNSADPLADLANILSRLGEGPEKARLLLRMRPLLPALLGYELHCVEDGYNTKELISFYDAYEKFSSQLAPILFEKGIEASWNDLEVLTGPLNHEQRTFPMKAATNIYLRTNKDWLSAHYYILTEECNIEPLWNGFLEPSFYPVLFEDVDGGNIVGGSYMLRTNLERRTYYVMAGFDIRRSVAFSLSIESIFERAFQNLIDVSYRPFRNGDGVFMAVLEPSPGDPESMQVGWRLDGDRAPRLDVYRDLYKKFRGTPVVLSQEEAIYFPPGNTTPLTALIPLCRPSSSFYDLSGDYSRFTKALMSLGRDVFIDSETVPATDGCPGYTVKTAVYHPEIFKDSAEHRLNG